MKIITSAWELRRTLAALRTRGLTIGFVPTMGYLHEGHRALVRCARKENGAVAVSLFVNPLQFGPKEDFRRYPRDFARDRKLLQKEGVAILFLPKACDFYPKDFQTTVSVSRLGRLLCGRSRPTHFAGVATVVAKLLNLVRPDVLYLGQKDYQQFRVIRQMVRDLEIPVRVRRVPIVREPDGLAMSSRNVFLSKAQRSEAVRVHRSLALARALVRAGSRDAFRIKQAARAVLKPVTKERIDYLEIVHADTLEPVVKLKKNQRVLVALAVFFSRTRLIDNVLIKVP